MEDSTRLYDASDAARYTRRTWGTQLTRRALTGPLTFIPGVRRLSDRIATPGSSTASYAYGVWLRHLVGASRVGFPTRYDTVVEIGPGKSLGTGLCALLCGTRPLYAWDIVAYSPVKRSLALLDQLVALFGRARRPLKVTTRQRCSIADSLRNS